MKKLIALTILVAASALAGPLKVATYPVAHPKKTAHAAKVVGGTAYKLVKAIVW